jgi:general secretion pathway protein C
VLDAYFKNHFWTFVAGVVALAGFLTARTVNAVVRQSLEVPPSSVLARASAAPPEAPEPQAPVPLEAFLERNLFGSLREDLQALEEAKRKAEQQAQDEAKDEGSSSEELDFSTCQQTSLSGALLATVVSSRVENSVAVFEDASSPTGTKMYQEGDTYEGARVARVAWRRVYFDNDGRCETMSLDEANARPRRQARVVRSRSKKGDGKDLGAGIEKVKSGQYEIPRAEIESVLSNLNTLATQARIVPSFKDGKANGFKLFSIKPNSLYQKIGIKNGDVVQRINGYEMNSPDKALEIYTKLKDASTITVDLQRRGRSKTLTYNIR